MDLMIWLVAFVFFVIIEAISTQLLSIWFAAGSLAAFIATLFGAPFWAQCVVFVVTSLLFALLIRPLAQRLMVKSLVPTNADGLIGQTVVVTENIDNFLLTGRVLAAGLEWSARSEDNSKIKKGAAVTVVRIEGVKLIVREASQE